MGVVYERLICPYKLLDMIYRFLATEFIYCSLNFQISTKRMNEETV